MGWSTCSSIASASHWGARQKELAQPIYIQHWVQLRLWRRARLWQIEAGRKEQHALPCAVRWLANRRGLNQITLVTLAHLLLFTFQYWQRGERGGMKRKSTDRRRQRETKKKNTRKRSKVLCQCHTSVEVLCHSREGSESLFSKPVALWSRVWLWT